MKRVKDVLYDADDLFDEVATNDLLRRHVKGSNRLEKKVRVHFSRLTTLVSNNDIANRVKNIRKRLQSVSNDMSSFSFLKCQPEGPISGIRKDQNTGSFVDPKNVVGRDKDKEVILDCLLHDQSDNAHQDVQVIAIVGIGGMGKTTLTQLVYNHEEVKNSFEKRWFACISDISHDAEVYQKIYESVCGEMPHSIGDLHTKIRGSIEGKKFLLVLDDVWDDDRVRWKNRMSLLSTGAKGSKIIVSTRSLLVSRVVGALRTHVLEGLSEEHSWDLFKSVVSFTPEQEGDTKWTELGREIVKKCANVPLAINCIASLLFGKDTIQEWELIRDEELPQLGQSHEDGIMSVLKLSYEHLPSALKHCFAYCSLFPKDHLFEKEELIELWIAQGYIITNNENQMDEDVGHSYFMDLVRMSFFQEQLWFNMFKMHDLIRDLAIHVAGEECLIVTASSNKISGTRHVSVGYVVDDPWLLLEPLHSINQLRSLLLTPQSLGSTLVRGIQFAKLKSLRALSLCSLQIENVPSSIEELKHLRYLDISQNGFKELPDSITKLVNLCTLKIRGCGSLEAWPDNFRKLFNLRHLHNERCYSLKHIPHGFEELTSLQHLDELRVDNWVKLGVLSKLKFIREMTILFEDGSEEWDGVESWQLPLALQNLCIHSYKGVRIPHWGNWMTFNLSLMPKLSSLSLRNCSGVKCLPSLRHIPNLKRLSLQDMYELEYIEDEEVGFDGLFIPDLVTLLLLNLPKLNGWSRQVEHHQLLSFPSLLVIWITDCPELKFMPLCPRLESMNLTSVGAELLLLLISDHIASPSITTWSSSLDYVNIKSIDLPESFPGESLTSLTELFISNCNKLNKVELPPLRLNNLVHLEVRGCPELELWGEKERGVDWDSLHKLSRLNIDVPPSSMSLAYRQQLGKFEINIWDERDEDWTKPFLSSEEEWSDSDVEEASLPSTST